MSEEYIHAEIESADKAIFEAFVRRMRAISALKEGRGSNQDLLSADLAQDAATIRRIVESAPDDVPAEAVARLFRVVIGECVAFQGVKSVRIAGGDNTSHVNAARGLFGYATPLVQAADPREALEAIAEEEGGIACLPWPELPGAGQWWPMLNESRFKHMRILAGWPNLPGHDASSLETAIIAPRTMAPSGKDHMLAIARDDLHHANRAFRDAEIEGEVVARVRSLALIKIYSFMPENDSRLDVLRDNGLDGVRIVGVLPQA